MDKQALHFLSELWADMQRPDFIWQALALITALSIAFFTARWWHGRRLTMAKGSNAEETLHSFGARLAFPIIAWVLVGIAHLVLKRWMSVNLLSLALPLLSSMVVVRAALHALRHAFPTARWLMASERFLAIVVWGWMALYITDLAPFVIEALESVSFTAGKQHFNLWLILSGIAVVIVTILAAMWLASVIEDRLMATEELDSSLRIVLIRITRAVLTLAAILLGMVMVGIDITALSVFTGALGVGLGFGLQKIASNYVSGFIILLDRSIRLGNVIQVDANTAGTVTQITTRYTVLSHPNGVEYLVPNEALVANTVQNQSFSNPKVRVTTSIGVAYDSDVDGVLALMQEVAKEHPRILNEPAPRAWLANFGDSAINLELTFWIADPEAGIGNVRAEANLLLWKAFKQAGITIPFPQREVRVINASTPMELLAQQGAQGG